MFRWSGRCFLRVGVVFFWKDYMVYVMGVVE